MYDSVFRLVLESGPLAQGVLAVLFLFSVVSWAIVGQKLADFRRARQQSVRFLQVVRSGAEVSEVYRASRVLRASPLCGLFRAGYELINGPGGWSGDREDFWKAMDGAASEQVGMLERYLHFLATVGNVSPFIGLFGTVWGIMDAFRNIGVRGSANLAVVAPGIAQALVATAAGLGAAIPAVMAYNYFLGRIDMFQREVDRFAVDLRGILLGGPRP